MALRKPVDYVAQFIGPLASHRWRALVRYLNSWINLPLRTDEPFAPDGTKEVAGNLGTVIYDAYTDPENPRYDKVINLSHAEVDNFTPGESDAEVPDFDRNTEAQQWAASVQVSDGGAFTDETADERTGLVKGPATIGGYGRISLSQTNQNAGYACDSVTWLAQVFTPAESGYIWQIALQLYRVGLPGTTATIAIQACDGAGHPDGVDLCYATYAVNSLSATPGAVVSFAMGNWLNGIPWWFDSSQKYAIVVRTTGAGGTLDMGWRYYNSSGYDDAHVSSDSGATWGSTAGAYDCFYFIIYSNDNDTSYYNVYANTWEAQTFIAAATGHIRRVVFKGYVSYPNNPLSIIAKIRATAAGLPSGADLATETTDFFARVTLENFFSRKLWTDSYSNGKLTSYLDIDFTTPPAVTVGTVYALLMQCTAATAIGFRWAYAASFAAGGNRCQSTNGGVNWSTKTEDFLMEIWYTVTEVDLFPAAIAFDDYIAYGADNPFTAIMQDISVVGAGTYTVAWEYSQGGGAWAACVGLTDTSNGFRNQWNQTITHTPQGDWAPETLNGVQAYYLRCRITDTGAGYTQPKGTYCLLKRTLN
ncbi:MAG: hypothetical protein WC551_09965 [Patescibacteria group bacterium]